jgi:hypothetical protein
MSTGENPKGASEKTRAARQTLADPLERLCGDIEPVFVIGSQRELDAGEDPESLVEAR